jgi:hypothetical protein
VLTWFALRYIVEVKVTVRWRSLQRQQQHVQRGMGKHCSNSCYKVGLCTVSSSSSSSLDYSTCHADSVHSGQQQECAVLCGCSSRQHVHKQAAGTALVWLQQDTHP